ncbi:MAG TPA: hypothetical protein VF175_10300 [Lacipirellula sp.]
MPPKLPTGSESRLISRLSSRNTAAGSLLACLLAAFGCGEIEPITTYEVERKEPRARAVDVDQVRDSLDHMLVAIVPDDDTAWFFKLVARGDAIDEVCKPFQEFIASVELGEKGETPTWKLPEGWAEKEGGEMRAATIEVPHGDKNLELAVSSLPLSGDRDDYLTRNVNRWLGQLQQGSLDQKTVKGLAKPLPHKGGEATYVELVGVMQQTPGRMPPGHPPTGSQMAAATAGSSRPSDATPRPAGTNGAAATQPAAEFAKPAEFTYDAPEGWQPGPVSMMRKAAFLVTEGDRRAEVTVMPFPATGAMADPIAQAQRWAGQAGLTLSEQQVKNLSQQVEISSVEGQQFELLGPKEGQAPLGILAAMVQRGDQVWFFKMTGDRDLVEKQREPFAKFLQSIKFTDK